MIRIKGSRKINPEKSSKLIWAVAAGLLLLFAAFIFLLTWQPKPQDRRQLIEQTLAYLKDVRCVLAIDIALAPDRVTLVFESTCNQDFPRIARYAAIRLAAKLPAFELLLARNRAQNVERRIEVRAGEIVSEGAVGSPASRQ